MIAMWIVTCVLYIVSLKFGGYFRWEDGDLETGVSKHTNRDFTPRSILWCIVFTIPFVNFFVSIFFIIDIITAFFERFSKSPISKKKLF
jgi:Na+/proline symporter